MAMTECSASYRRTMSWRPPGADRLSLGGSKVNTHVWLCAVDDSTVNIIFCIIIIIIYIVIIIIIAY